MSGCDCVLTPSCLWFNAAGVHEGIERAAKTNFPGASAVQANAILEATKLTQQEIDEGQTWGQKKPEAGGNPTRLHATMQTASQGEDGLEEGGEHIDKDAQVIFLACAHALAPATLKTYS